MTLHELLLGMLQKLGAKFRSCGRDANPKFFRFGAAKDTDAVVKIDLRVEIFCRRETTIKKVNRRDAVKFERFHRTIYGRPRNILRCVSSQYINVR